MGVYTDRSRSFLTNPRDPTRITRRWNAPPTACAENYPGCRRAADQIKVGAAMRRHMICLLGSGQVSGAGGPPTYDLGNLEPPGPFF